VSKIYRQTPYTTHKIFSSLETSCTFSLCLQSSLAVSELRAAGEER